MSDLFEINKRMINNYAKYKFDQDSNLIKQYRKNMCRSANENIHTYDNKESTKENTILFISLSELNKGKIIILNQLLKSKYNCIVGIDIKYYKNENEFNIKLEEYSNFIKDKLKGDINSFFNINKIFLDDNYHKKKYGEKITNYNGRWENNPSKFGSLEWFHSSSFEYFWFIEDDIFCKDFDKFLKNYDNLKNDLICTINYNHLPKWYYDNWKVGDILHGFEHAHLYISRYSKQFANNFFNFIKNSDTTSHHELLIPYILNYYHMSHYDLKEEDKKTLHINNGFTKSFNLSTNSVNNYDTEIFHPFKIK